MTLVPRYDPRDPDAALVPIFKHGTRRNDAMTAKEGRPIYDDVELVEIRLPGTRNSTVHPVNEISHWHVDAYTGEQRPITYAQRFATQYHQFKTNDQQTKTGTPLEFLSFLTEGKRAELRSLNIYTVEALAIIDGQELKNLGQGGREWKNGAIDYMEKCKNTAPVMQLQEQLEVLRQQQKLLEEDNERLKLQAAQRLAAAGSKAANTGEAAQLRAQLAELQAKNDDMANSNAMLAQGEVGLKSSVFAAMGLDELRAYIVARTGVAPRGNLSRAGLMRLAADCERRAQTEGEVA